MTGERRRVDYVAARPVLRAIAMGVVCCTFGNMLVLGCAFALLGFARSSGSGPWLLAAAALAQFLGGVSALIAYGWSR